MLLFDMHALSPHSIKTCFLEIRCHESAVALLTRMFQSILGRLQLGGGGVYGGGGSEPSPMIEGQIPGDDVKMRERK